MALAQQPPRTTMASVNVRMPYELLHWLNDQAAEDGTTMSQVVRSAVVAAIARAGQLERYGIEVEHDSPEPDV